MPVHGALHVTVKAPLVYPVPAAVTVTEAMPSAVQVPLKPLPVAAVAVADPPFV